MLLFWKICLSTLHRMCHRVTNTQLLIPFLSQLLFFFFGMMNRCRSERKEPFVNGIEYLGKCFGDSLEKPKRLLLFSITSARENA